MTPADAVAPEKPAAGETVPSESAGTQTAAGSPSEQAAAREAATVDAPAGAGPDAGVETTEPLPESSIYLTTGLQFRVQHAAEELAKKLEDAAQAGYVRLRRVSSDNFVTVAVRHITHFE